MRRIRTFYPPMSAESDEAGRREYEEALRRWMEQGRGVIHDFAFASRRNPRITSANFIEWFKPRIDQADRTLREIFANHRIEPGEILEILASTLADEFLYPLRLKNKLRSESEREKDVRVLERAARILNDWTAVLPSLYLEAPEHDRSDYRLADEVKRAAKEIRDLGESVAHRPKDIGRIIAAKKLQEIFQQRTGR